MRLNLFDSFPISGCHGHHCAGRGRSLLGVLSGRTLLRLSGPDALTFLDGVLTRGPTLGPSTASPPPQACLATTLLTPQGKVLHEVLVHRLDDALILETRAEFADDLRRRLTLYRLRAKAEISIDDTLVPVWSETAEPRPD